MGSPVSLSGFNNIDFNLILNTIMEQERVPVVLLQNNRAGLERQDSQYSVLATKLASLETATDKLSTAAAFATRTVSNSDVTAVSAVVTDTTPAGTYDVVVQELARAQVIASTSTYADTDTTIVASGGTITIGGVAVTVSGDTTLEGLATAITGATGSVVTASVINSGTNTYRLVLSGNDTGTTNAFTVTNALTGGAGLTFADLDVDGVSGDDASDNAVSATDAAATINNIAITSATNTLDEAVPGATITLLKKAPATTVTLTVTRDDEALKTRVDEFVASYNDLTTYIDAQFTSAADGAASSIGRDGLLRGLRSALRSTVSEAYSVGGTYSYLAEVGIGSDRSGQLTVDATLLNDALSTAASDVESLFVGAGGTDGLFTVLGSLVTGYTEAGGLLPDIQQRLDDQVGKIDDRIRLLEDQLAVRRSSLEAEFIAADLAIAQLNTQQTALGAIGNEFRLF